ncbi:MAG TPA: hypothetical protein VK213_13780 [Bacteroidales bacterium]|nr:hypothetical protein [Bacteroidales bacterium]
MSINGYGYKIKADKELIRKPLSHFENDELKSFDIPSIIGNLKKEKSWLDGELISVILVNNPAIKVLLTLLHEGTEVISYQANDSITFQVVQGSLILHLRDDLISLNNGEVLTISEKIKYSFDTVEETAFLLTLVSEKEK